MAFISTGDGARMVDTKDSRPLAFVIMPFGDGFDIIYNLFLRDALEGAGFCVERADNSVNAQNILKDVVSYLWSASLVVADLTDSNPNVYYELGLAHAFRRPVVLLTQSITDLPFDLRSYRVIPYKTHFAEIAEARRTLITTATGILNGSVQFSNPVIDFLPSTLVQHPSTVHDGNVEGDAGFLDNIIEMEAGFEEMTRAILEVVEASKQVGEDIAIPTAALARFQQTPGSGTAARARVVFMEIASKLTTYAGVLRTATARYSPTLSRTTTSLEAVVQAKGPLSANDKDKLRDFVAKLSDIEQSAGEGMTHFNELKAIIDALPSVERTFNRARKHVVEGLGKFSEGIEQTIAAFTRVRAIAMKRLEE
jgi:hypothetical protein